MTTDPSSPQQKEIKVLKKKRISHHNKPRDPSAVCHTHRLCIFSPKKANFYCLSTPYPPSTFEWLDETAKVAEENGRLLRVISFPGVLFLIYLQSILFYFYFILPSSMYPLSRLYFAKHFSYPAQVQ
jgi:hypothetical protein